MSTPTEDGHVRLSSIADDILRKTLTFLTPADCTRGPAAASKFMRVVASTANRQRYVDNYVLRGDKHGVVHALATALGTRQWPTRQVQLEGAPDDDEPYAVFPTAATPPSRLGITAHRNIPPEYQARYGFVLRRAGLPPPRRSGCA
jgi:hypothetical protein